MLQPAKDPSAPVHDPDPTPAVTPASLRAAIHDQLARLDGFSVAEFELDPESHPVERFEAVTRTAISAATAVLSEVIRLYELPDVTVSQRGADPLIDLIALGRMELNAFLERVALARGIRWERIALCDSAMRNTRRCLRAVDEAIARREGMSFVHHAQDEELKVALAIRRLYVRFYRDVAGDVLPDSGTIRVRLRAAAAAIGILLEHALSPSIRVHDRYMFREFRTRIRAALAEGATASVLDSNIKLWEDLHNFSTLLLDISKREELRHHDRLMINAMLPTLEAMEASSAPPGGAPVGFRTQLTLVEGRDRELDEYIRAGGDWRDLLRILRRVQRSLASAAEASIPHTNSGSWQGIV